MEIPYDLCLFFQRDFQNLVGLGSQVFPIIHSGQPVPLSDGYVQEPVFRRQSIRPN